MDEVAFPVVPQLLDDVMSWRGSNANEMGLRTGDTTCRYHRVVAPARGKDFHCILASLAIPLRWGLTILPSIYYYDLEWRTPLTQRRVLPIFTQNVPLSNVLTLSLADSL